MATDPVEEVNRSWTAGAGVRLVNDPGREGTLTGKTMTRAGTLFYQVRFPGFGTSWQPKYELELIQDELDLYTLLEQGTFGRSGDLRRGLTHITLSGRLANVVYSMRTTNTDFLAYQFKPVLAMLDSPSNGLLIADEVGLGKTIEAGLIWTELRARFDARRLLIICPAMLRTKWKTELRLRFGVDAQVLDAGGLLEELQTPKEMMREGKALICSIQGIRPPRGWEDEDEKNRSTRGKLAAWLTKATDQDPVVDLLVFDEAHYMRNPETQMNELAHLLRSVSDHVLLLSATPINLHSGDLHSLLKIVDPDSFQTAWLFDQVLSANLPLMAARREVLRGGDAVEIQKNLHEARTHPLIASSQVLEELSEHLLGRDKLDDPSERIKLAESIERINPLSRIVTRTRKVEVDEQRIVRDPHLESVPMTAAEQAFYEAVTLAVREYAELNDVSDGFLLAMPQRMISSCMTAAGMSITGEEVVLDQADVVEELQYESLGDREEAAVKRDWDRPEVRTHVGPLIQHVRDAVRGVVDLERLRREDTKYKRLVGVLKEFFGKHPAEKIVLFSYFRPTLAYLEKRLHADGINAVRLVGGMDADKQEIIDRFQADPAARVLLSSEVASEGVDLQFCRVVVNYDLPWNPMKVEQRIGRIDRIGQKSKLISVWNLYHKDTIDERIVERLYVRLKIFEQALGGLEVVLGEQIARLTADLLTRELTAEEEARLIEQRALAIEKRKNEEAHLEEEASGLIAHGGTIMEAIRAADRANRRVTDQDLYAYVVDYLERHARGHSLREVCTVPREALVRLPGDIAAALSEFVQRRRIEGMTRLAQGIEVHCRFQNIVSAREGAVEIISQFHPLVRFISEELDRRQQGCFPLVAVRLQGGTAVSDVRKGDFAFVLSRWSFAGVKPDEEIHARVAELANGVELSEGTSFDLVNAARLEGKDWLEAPVQLDLAIVRERIAALQPRDLADFEAGRDLKEKENNDRAAFQVASLERHLLRKRAIHETNREKHLLAGRKGLARAEEQKLRTLEQNLATKREALQAKAKLNSNRFEVCAGVIRIE